jgi:acetyltransferase-like isoleucine patch superfamily enzyme
MKILKILKELTSLKFRFLLNLSIVKSKGQIIIGNNVKISGSRIIVHEGFTLKIGDNSRLSNVNLDIKGDVLIGEFNIFETGNSKVKIEIIGTGDLLIGSYNRIRSKIWIRYNGKLSIANHNNINEGSEIRCDKKIVIGSYNQVSYNCMIWDTNTHNIYSFEERRRLTKNKYPIFGFEYERPKTSPVIIGDDSWIGKDVALLKGTKVGHRCIIGFRTVLSNVTVEDNLTVFNDLKITKIQNSI